MGGIGGAILLMAALPFLAMVVGLFAVSIMFKRARRPAFYASLFIVGYGFGNFVAHEPWADPLFRFSIIKPYFEAPIHSILYGFLSLAVVLLISTLLQGLTKKTQR
jgi:nitric oxide reductase large subunit